MINDIKLILRDRCSIEDNYNLSLIERLFYSFKAIIAIIFDLKEKNISDEKINIALVESNVIYVPDNYSYISFKILCMNKKLFNFRMFYYSDSN